MIFHFIIEQKEGSQMCVVHVPYGTELPKLRVEDKRPSYVTIDKEEIESVFDNMSEAQTVSYLKMIKNKLDFGGRVFIEVANYE